MLINELQNIKLIVFDFDGVFTDNRVLVNENGVESVFCWRSDGLGLEKIKKIGIKIAIISSEKNNLVQVRASKLGIYCKNNINNKKDELIKTAKYFNVDLKDTIFVGNDINDIPAFKIAGIAIGVNDCNDHARLYTNFCLNTKGGYGAVREICEMLEEANNQKQTIGDN